MKIKMHKLQFSVAVLVSSLVLIMLTIVTHDLTKDVVLRWVNLALSGYLTIIIFIYGLSMILISDEEYESFAGANIVMQILIGICNLLFIILLSIHLSELSYGVVFLVMWIIYAIGMIFFYMNTYYRSWIINQRINEINMSPVDDFESVYIKI